MKNNSGKSQKSTSSQTSWYDNSASSSMTVIQLDNTPRKKQRGANIEDAVYGQIQVFRALGKETVTVYEIAKALSLPHHLVVGAVRALESKGVRPI